MIPTPDITTLIHYLTNDSSQWLTAFLPWTGIFIGVSIAFLIGKAIINTIQDWLHKNEEEEELN